MQCVWCSCKEQGERHKRNLHFARKRNMSSSPMKAKLAGNHLLLQGLVKIKLSCPDFSCVWCIVYDEPDRMLLCFLSRTPSFIYDAGAGLGEGFDIIKEPHDHDGDLEYGLYRISFLSLYDSLSSFSSFSFAPFSFFIYLYNATWNNRGERQKREHAKWFSLDKIYQSTSGSNCSGVTLWTEHHLFNLLISRWFHV